MVFGSFFSFYPSPNYLQISSVSWGFIHFYSNVRTCIILFDIAIHMQGFRSSPSSASLPTPVVDVVRQVEAKYPALLFKQQLTAYVEKIYGIIRDNLKKELASLLALCIQVI